jgi:elongation factor G
MNVYETKNLRNLTVAGHAGAGKTTFIEALLFQSGVNNRMGSVDDNNTTSDFHELEHERGNSIFSTAVNVENNGVKINFFDTPGFDDFIGEMIAPMHVSETGLILINAQNGVEVGSEHAFNYAEKLNKCIIFALNRLDQDKTDYDSIVESLKTSFGNSVTVFQYPLNPGGSFDSIVDLLSMKVIKTEGNNVTESDIPDSEKDKAENLRSELVESVAESDEDLMNLYFEEGDLTDEQLSQGIKKALINRQLFPVFCINAKNNVGTKSLLDFVHDSVPAPNEIPLPIKEGSVKVKADPNEKTSLFVFKMLSDPKIGDLTYFKVKSGTLKSGMDMVNEKRSSNERFGQLFVVNGKKREEVDSLQAGDIGATVKLKTSHINDTMHEKGFNVKFEDIAYPRPKVRTAIVPKTKGEEEKVGVGLNAIHEEDPTVIIEHSPELKQTILHCQGELHLAVIKWRLENRYKVEAQFITPKVAYRETIQKKITGSYRHKKQSGGAGQFAEVHMMIEPWHEGLPDPSEYSIRGKELTDLEWGGKLEYINSIVGGVIDQRFLPAILKGVMDKMEIGPLTGSYVRDIRVCIYDGKMHPVDSNEAAFKMAGSMVFKDIFTKANPKILEPIYDVEIKVPEEFVGDVMSDLPSRRGVIQGIDSEGTYQKIKAKMPLSELDKYSTALRSMTQARAAYSAEFDEYQAVPPNIQQELIDAYKKESEEE